MLVAVQSERRERRARSCFCEQPRCSLSQGELLPLSTAPIVPRHLSEKSSCSGSDTSCNYEVEQSKILVFYRGVELGLFCWCWGWLWCRNIPPCSSWNCPRLLSPCTLCVIRDFCSGQISASGTEKRARKMNRNSADVFNTAWELRTRANHSVAVTEVCSNTLGMAMRKVCGLEHQGDLSSSWCCRAAGAMELPLIALHPPMMFRSCSLFHRGWPC